MRPYRHARTRSQDVKVRAKQRLRKLESRYFDGRLLDGIDCPDELAGSEAIVQSAPNGVWLGGHAAAIGFVEKLVEGRWRANTAPARLETNDS